jgi:hypothetical protein
MWNKFSKTTAASLRVAQPPRFSVLAAAAALATLALPVAVAAQAHASATVTSHFVWTATSSNTGGDSSLISNGATNGSPDDLLFVTPNWDPNGLCGCIYEPAPIGVRYDTSSARWAVFREDGQIMPANEGYNVLVVPPNKAGSSVFVQTSTSANTTGDYTLINDPLTNGQPNAKLLITQDFNPGGTGGTYNPHNVGVWYDTAAGEWGIFNEDLASMPLGVSFNVMVGQAPSNGGTMKTLKTTNTNRSGDTTFISNSQTTGNPNNVTFTTQNWNPGGAGGTYNNSQTGVWYTGAREGVFNENQSSPPLNSAFNILVFSS